MGLARDCVLWLILVLAALNSKRKFEPVPLIQDFVFSHSLKIFDTEFVDKVPI
jgi:hypothetical protein